MMDKTNLVQFDFYTKQSYKKYENHYITGIKPETYEVTISDDINKKGGWVIRYEDVTFL